MSNNQFFKNQLKEFYQNYAHRLNINSNGENNHPNDKSRTYTSNFQEIHDVVNNEYNV